MFYLEVVDEYGNILENGQEGKLICTSLHNRGTPFIRYEIGDIVIINKNKGKTILTNIIGRTNDIAILPSGKKVPGLSFYYAVHDALVDYEKDVIEHQVVQISKDCFVVNMVVANNISFKRINDRMQSVFDKYLEKNLKVEVKKVDQIDRAVAGKFKHFISLI
jgi:phenylacetate-CoA ligase